MDPQRFGQFIKELRAERGLTQKQLAERLFVSDKAVSKWERGISMPEISLLLPLAQILGVSTTELLSGRRLPEEAPLTRPQVEELLNNTLRLSAGERAELQQLGRGRKLIILALALLGTAVNISVLLLLGFTPLQLLSDLGTVLVLCGIFAVLSLFTMRSSCPPIMTKTASPPIIRGRCV
ncbi:MAG: helix-turn-helix transcriptional regulator [Firmicutes bacterium]|nr:helix-turn-helix transcriptional regulator [Bacillota bacterium]